MKIKGISKKKNKSQRFSNLVKKLHLHSFGSLVFGNKTIRFNKKNKELMISEQEGNETRSHTIELDDVTSISLKKSYDSIGAGELNKRSIGEFLKYIALKFEHANNRDSTVFSIYEKGKDDNFKDLRNIDLSSKKLYHFLLKIIGTNNNEKAFS